MTTGLRDLTDAQLRNRKSQILTQLEGKGNAGPKTSRELDALEAEGFELAAEVERRQLIRELREVGSATTTTATETRASASGPWLSRLPHWLESPSFLEHRSNGWRGKYAFPAGGSLREIRAPLDSTATSAGAFIRPDRSPVVPQVNADRRPSLADLIDRQPTGTNAVEYVRDTSSPGGGGAAAETAEGALKPEAPMSFEIVTDSVRVVAHWVQITRQAAEDNAQLMAYIGGRLTYGLDYRLDNQLLNGNGTSPNLRGILNTTGLNLHAPAAAEARVISIRRSMTLCQVDEYNPTGAVLHPNDWELVELSTDNNGLFRVTPNVGDAMAPRIWGLNVVATTAMASGSALVGDFRMGATLWDRQAAQVYITDSHASTFTSNVLTLLAELRVGLSVYRPSAFCRITFNGGT